MGAFSSKGKSNLVILDGKQNSSKYIASLFHNLLSFILKKYSGNEYSSKITLQFTAPMRQ